MNQYNSKTTICLSLVFFAIGSFAAADEPGFETEIIPFFGRYCLDCHGDSATEGNLSLEQIDPKVGGGPDFESWRIIYERVKCKDRPPKEADQPAAQERQAFVTWIRGKLLETQQPGSPKKTIQSTAADELLIRTRQRHCEKLVIFVRKLESILEGEGLMMDNALIVDLSDAADQHHAKGYEWPMIVIGDLGGRLKTAGRYLRYRTPVGPSLRFGS